MNILYHHRTQGKWAEGVHIREIVKSLTSIGNNVTIVSPPGIEIYVDEVSSGNERKGVLKNVWSSVSRFSPQFIFELSELLYNLYASRKIDSVLSQNCTDIIYERYSFFCTAGVKAAKKRKIPFFLEVNEVSGIERQRSQAMVKLADRIERSIFADCNAIFTVSNYLKREIQKRGVPESKIFVLPNGINENDFKGPVKNRGKPEAARNKTVITFVGHFSKWDNLDLFLETYSGLLSKRKDIFLFIVGDGELRAELENKARELKIDKDIHFFGKVPRSEVVGILSGSDICVIPHSNPFGSPMVLFECMAMGKPVVAPDVGPVLDVVKDKVTALIFKVGDFSDLESKLTYLIDNPAERSRIGSFAKDHVYANHLWKHNAQKIADVFKSSRSKRS